MYTPSIASVTTIPGGRSEIFVGDARTRSRPQEMQSQQIHRDFGGPAAIESRIAQERVVDDSRDIRASETDLGGRRGLARIVRVVVRKGADKDHKVGSPMLPAGLERRADGGSLVGPDRRGDNLREPFER